MKDTLIATCYVKDGIKMGTTSATMDDFKCGDTLTIPGDMNNLYITKGNETITLLLDQLVEQYPTIKSLSICDKATKTTFGTCDGTTTQDLSSLYVQPNGKMYFGGECIFNPYLVFVYIFLIIFIIFVVVIGGLWLLWRYKNKISYN